MKFDLYPSLRRRDCYHTAKGIETKMNAPTASPDKLLFTPGPLTTSATVKQAMLRDLGSLDSDFLATVRSVRMRLLDLGPYPRDQYDCVLMQGSGTYVVESVISSVIPRQGKLLALVNGAYGRRIAQTARIHGIALDVLEVAENRKFTPDLVAAHLASAGPLTHVAVVHCETTSGILNQVEEIGLVVHAAGAAYIVDAMSSFGAIPIDMPGAHIDFLISSANKCIEGVPGFGFVLAQRQALLAAKGNARTLSLDLYDQWASMEADNDHFRFTPPVQTILAFEQALNELDQEGGVRARGERYRRNHIALCRGMREIGFEIYLAEEDQSFIITSFRYPAHPAFRFAEFYERLWALGFAIYPGKLSRESCFRIGTIGRITAADIEALLDAIRLVLGEMGVESASPNIAVPRPTKVKPI
ncbi:MAG TPA: 2-aminoethylphosphonate--pyruvate transaminase [Terracidiphilus sp.]|nr:2-aminoethylphosphonate--pyruvate transaminase [Terracidiphilus sp.]